MAIGLAALSFTATVAASDPIQETARKLEGLDGYVDKVLRDWNGVGIGVGVVVNDQLVFFSITTASIPRMTSDTVNGPSTS